MLTLYLGIIVFDYRGSTRIETIGMLPIILLKKKVEGCYNNFQQEYIAIQETQK